MTIQDTRDAASLITVLDPRDGSLVGRLEPATREDVAAAVRASRAAQPGWEDVSPEQRGQLLGAAANALHDHLDELAELNLRETGKPIDDARGGVEAGAGTLAQYAELGPLQRGHSLRGGRLAADYTIAEPRGVAVALTPWNDPVAVAAGLLGAALVTGNTVIHKPSERCPHLGARLGEILAEVFPPDVLITLTGGGETGELLTHEPDVDVVAHVGSSATGERIARTAALTRAHVIRENGGNDPLVIDNDVDPRWAAAQAALGSFANAGQICTSVERIYVHRAIADEFREALVAEARERNEQRLIGPLVDHRMRDEVHAQVSHALASGATALCGGEVPDGPGSWYPATVLWDCTPDMTVMTEETFGPVAPVQVVDDFDEGLRLAAEGRYGLAATVLTNRIDHANRAVAALRVGTVKVNGVFGGAPGGAAQPRRDSGDGFGYGPELLDEFTQVKVVHIGVGEARS
ncbi:aldehyde dehydrogenase [Aeromicrobium phragmitis]|uniref:Aldehyde dehydrogenase n=1 Tax=Aeromicrobium phragmitis TaxID=2478914 RepID=A0A3L8PJU1_9ACTN|nr:aldehyde dehydrogenase family protein [Aeromicrobium phragmitis]RLV55490.1 aldehyde dehydrogenase [Aeromicrobium phragmitis]